MTSKANNSRRLPAEFEPAGSVCVAWPHCEDDWPGRLAAVQDAFVELVALLRVAAPVYVLVDDKTDSAVRQRFADPGPVAIPISSSSSGLPVRFLNIPTDRGWLRDTAFAPVETSAGTQGVCWDFNGWARYENHKRDAQVAEQLCEAFGLAAIPARHGGRHVVLEGGAYDVNGAGSILVTRECLLDSQTQRRNPGFTADDYAQVFSEYLGAPHVIWLAGGLAGDDTHGHVDTVARFISPDTIVCATATSADASTSNHIVLRENREILRRARDPNGNPFRIVEVPLPAPQWENDGAGDDSERLPASYLNFLILNDWLIVPTFDDANDAEALSILGRVTGRRVAGFPCADIIVGGGGVHCLTQPLPATF